MTSPSPACPTTGWPRRATACLQASRPRRARRPGAVPGRDEGTASASSPPCRGACEFVVDSRSTTDPALERSPEAVTCIERPGRGVPGRGIGGGGAATADGARGESRPAATSLGAADELGRAAAATRRAAARARHRAREQAAADVTVASGESPRVRRSGAAGGAGGAGDGRWRPPSVEARP